MGCAWIIGLCQECLVPIMGHDSFMSDLDAVMTGAGILQTLLGERLRA